LIEYEIRSRGKSVEMVKKGTHSSTAMKRWEARYLEGAVLDNAKKKIKPQKGEKKKSSLLTGTVT